MKALIFSFLFIFGAIAAASTLPEPEKQLLKKVHDHCQSSPATHADEDLLRKLPENVDNVQVMAHMLCMSMGVGLQKQTGEIDLVVMKTKISMVIEDKSTVHDMVHKCGVTKGTPEKTAMTMWMCFIKNHINYMHVL